MYFIFLLLLLLVLIRINNVGVKICLSRFFLIFASTEEFALYRERALVKFRHPPLQSKPAAAAAAAPTMTLEAAAASSATATMTTTTTTCPEIGNLYTILTGYQERLHRVELDHQMLQLQLVLLLLVEMLLLLLQPPAPAAAL